MPIYPHLTWYIKDGRPYLYRTDLMKYRGFNTFAEACEFLGIDIEDAIRSR